MWTAVTGPDGKRHGNGYDKDADVYMHDPMEDPLPNAPSMKMYCTYGVDKPVERWVDWALWRTMGLWVHVDAHGSQHEDVPHLWRRQVDGHV